MRFKQIIHLVMEEWLTGICCVHLILDRNKFKYGNDEHIISFSFYSFIYSLFYFPCIYINPYNAEVLSMRIHRDACVFTWRVSVATVSVLSRGALQP